MRFRFTLTFLLSLLTFTLGAQSLPSLPAASGVVTGTLPNGITYYLVSNPSVKGHADMALVQKGPVREEVAKAALSELPHFQSGKPYQFLAKLGVGYDNFGYIRSFRLFLRLSTGAMKADSSTARPVRTTST